MASSSTSDADAQGGENASCSTKTMSHMSKEPYQLSGRARLFKMIAQHNSQRA
ncbi:hypothetical protein DY000_02039654 [Brassica cretica]|uniref:Uncharacterized protein n=1 Tax=Brassica cretica TaxID=69181 RepID=A0ABQ7BFW6_BRACR|nr:hypothetical protein DY000_02039654 [Brassica cretica]